MTTIVTGAAGFIGHAVATALAARGDDVVGIDNLNDYYRPDLKYARLQTLSDQPRFRFELCDFSDSEALTHALAATRPSRIVHLGAQAGVRYSIESPHAYGRSNLTGHLNLLELARRHGVEHMVYASSSSVYGGNTKLPFAVGDRVDRPRSFYAATKRANEVMSESYAHLFRIPLTGLRFFTVYGPWGRPDMAAWLFTDAILTGTPIKLFAGGTLRRDFTFIDDIVAGVLAALDRPPSDGGALPLCGDTPHAIYNLGNNRPVTVNDFVAAIEIAADRIAHREYLPMQPGDVEATCADIDATTAALGWTPSTDLTDGIPKFVAWYRAWTSDHRA